MMPAKHEMGNRHVLPVTAEWRRHDMETLSALPAFCVGNPPVTGGFLTQKASDADRYDFFVIILSQP